MGKTDIRLTAPAYTAWLSAAVCCSCFAALILLPFWLLPKGLFWLLALILLLPLIPALESLLLTPLYRLSGRFVYYSDTLFVTRSDSALQLHAGTLYDYVRVLYWHKRSGKQQHGSKTQQKITAQRLLTTQLLQGMLALCDDIARGNIAPDTVLSATSYFFTDRSAAKLGFSSTQVSALERLNLLSVALSLAIRLSLSKGRLSWPDLKHIRAIQTSASRLLAQRATLERLLQYLNTER